LVQGLKTTQISVRFDPCSSTENWGDCFFKLQRCTVEIMSFIVKLWPTGRLLFTKPEQQPSNWPTENKRLLPLKLTTSWLRFWSQFHCPLAALHVIFINPPALLSGRVGAWLTSFFCLFYLSIIYSYYIYLLYTRKTLHNIRKWVLTHFFEKNWGQGKNGDFQEFWCFLNLDNCNCWYHGRKQLKISNRSTRVPQLMCGDFHFISG
jgi:hypothetical protein